MLTTRSPGAGEVPATDLEDVDGPPTVRIPRTPPVRVTRRRKVLSIVVVAVLLVTTAVWWSQRVDRWQTDFVEDFSTAVPAGSFPGKVYGGRWTSYDGFKDTSGVGLYAPAKVLSVHDGVLDYYLHSVDGQALAAAPVPLVTGSWGGQKYGKFTVRFYADPVPGYKVAWLLWPDTNNWNDGEFDFPEGNLDGGTIFANQHCVGDPEQNCLTVDTGVPVAGAWHTTVIEWSPHGVTYLLDDVMVAHTELSPSTPFHLVLQTETMGTGHATGTGHILVDSVTIASRK